VLLGEAPREWRGQSPLLLGGGRRFGVRQNIGLDDPALRPAAAHAREVQAQLAGAHSGARRDELALRTVTLHPSALAGART
jgi:hypothetical protein